MFLSVNNDDVGGDSVNSSNNSANCGVNGDGCWEGSNNDDDDGVGDCGRHINRDTRSRT